MSVLKLNMVSMNYFVLIFVLVDYVVFFSIISGEFCFIWGF